MKEKLLQVRAREYKPVKSFPWMSLRRWCLERSFGNEICCFRYTQCLFWVSKVENVLQEQFYHLPVWRRALYRCHGNSTILVKCVVSGVQLKELQNAAWEHSHESPIGMLELDAQHKLFRDTHTCKPWLGQYWGNWVTRRHITNNAQWAWSPGSRKTIQGWYSQV